MKSPVALFVVSVLTLVYVLFRMLTVHLRATPASEVALIKYAIEHRCVFCRDFPAYAVDTAFQTFGPTTQQAHEARKRIVRGALTHMPFLAHADLTALVRPNTSHEVLRLQQQQARTNGKDIAPYALTFSAPAELSDGSRCYYVETRALDRHWGSGDIYVVRRGAVVSVLDVWIN